jgi:D-amino-acid dehydrogenase
VSDKTDVLIVGGGAIGVCSAYFLRQAGYSVRLLERGEIAAGSSYGNAGLVVPSHSIPLAAPGVLAKGIRWMLNPESPFYIKPRLDRALLSWLWKFRAACKPRQMERSLAVIRDLSFLSLELFDQIAAIEGLEFCFEKKGMLSVFKTEKGLEEGRKEAQFLDEKGVEAKVVDKEGIRALEPDVEINAIGGVYFPQDGHLVPDRYVRGLAQHIQDLGVEVLTETEVTGFEKAGSRIEAIKTKDDVFSADQIVLAGGSWSPAVGADLGLRLPIQPAKGYSITYKRPATGGLSLPVMFGEAKVGVTPMDTSLRFAGTLELAGMDFSINQRRVQAILRAVPAYLPELDPARLEHLETWRGLRPCTPDGLPLLGRPAGFDNLVIAAGHAMIGISLSPITGRLVSQVIEGKETAVDLMPLNPDRFA